MQTATVSRRELNLRQRERTTRSVQKTLTVVLFLAPAFVFFFIFLVYPIFQSIYYSLFDWKGLGPAVDFVQLGNYGDILADPVFMTALTNGIIIVVLSLTLQLPLSLALALMIRRDLPGRLLFRTILFLPYVFSEVITGIIWIGLFQPDPQIGLINALLTLIPGVQAMGWLGDTNTVLLCIFVALTWKYFGFHMLLYMAGLSGIEHEIEEAAIVDGANRLQGLVYVTVPLLGPTIRTSVFLSVLGALQQFGLIWIMSKGGPVSASETMATYMYRYGFVRFSLGYGCAVAVVMLLICLTFSLIYQRFVPQQDYLGGISL